MKTKIVLWGENEKEEKILLGIELVESENLIRINIIPEEDATEIFYNQMMNQWREGQGIPMPESTSMIDRPLSMTEGLLPDNIKTQRQDILARAKTEWHFVILSSKLYESYADEINQIKERVNELSEFDDGIWEEMKAFWHKVQDQVQEKNLFREHAAELRTKTNELFDTLKSLKRAMNDVFEKTSKEHVDLFFQKLKDIEERIEKGLGLQPIFNELKDIQNRFKNTQFTRKHHNDVWKRLDGAFKKVKEKKFGKIPAGGSTVTNRLSRRYEGLLSAIEKMEQSIGRDIKDKKFQERRIGTTDGQLEMQIRQAKMAMIEERIASKQIKLDDMLKTKEDIVKKLEIEKQKTLKKEEQRKAKTEIKEAVKSAKQDIAQEIEGKVEELKENDEQLQKAAKEILESKAQPAVTEISSKEKFEKKDETKDDPSSDQITVESSSPKNDDKETDPEVQEDTPDKETVSNTTQEDMDQGASAVSEVVQEIKASAADEEE